MQYVILIYQGSTPLPGSPEWEGFPEEEKQKVYADYGAINQTSGVTPGPPMGLPENATTVRVEGGKTLTTDGPFVGMKEAVGGFFVLEADNLDAAIELAARVPAARLGGAIEIRPSEAYWNK
ncbi:MAG: YciI family protein [Acidimicrobiales bacterium]